LLDPHFTAALDAWEFDWEVLMKRLGEALEN